MSGTNRPAHGPIVSAGSSVVASRPSSIECGTPGGFEARARSESTAACASSSATCSVPMRSYSTVRPDSHLDAPDEVVPQRGRTATQENCGSGLR